MTASASVTTITMPAAAPGTTMGSPICLMPSNPKQKICAVRKVTFLGPSGVGKTSLIRRFANKSPSTAPPDCSLNTDFLVRMARSSQDPHQPPVKLQLWDTAGQERFGGIWSLANALFRNVDGVVLVLDRSDASSLAQVEQWHQRVASLGCASSVPMALVANKSDLPAQVASQQIQRFAQRHGLQFVMVCSALHTAHDVLNEQFNALIDALVFVTTTCACAIDPGSLPMAPCPLEEPVSCSAPSAVAESTAHRPVSRVLAICPSIGLFPKVLEPVKGWWPMDQTQTTERWVWCYYWLGGSVLLLH